MRSPVWALRAIPALLLLGSAPSLLAHAILVRSTPADGTVVHANSVELTLDYDSRIDSRLSTLTLQDSGGKKLPLQRESSTKPNELKAKAGDLAAGKYHVYWQALASDGHITRGVVSFTVEPAAGSRK
jgi:methionine-rich copper-binding protein CopC